MARKLLTILLIILANLFAFFVLGNILDALLGTGAKMTLSMVIFSIFPLIFWMFLYIQNIQKQLEQIDTNSDDSGKK